MATVLDADAAVVKSDAIVSEDLSKMPLINLKIGILDLMKRFWTLCIPLYFRSSMAALACSQPVASTLTTVQRAIIKVKSSQFPNMRK